MVQDRWFDENILMGFEIKKVLGALYLEEGVRTDRVGHVDVRDLSNKIRIWQRDIPHPEDEYLPAYSLYLGIRGDSVEFFAGASRTCSGKYDVPELFQFVDNQPAKYAFGITGLQDKWPKGRQPIDDKDKLYLDELIIQLNNQNQLPDQLRENMLKCIDYIHTGRKSV